jgi:hypothetical protein
LYNDTRTLLVRLREGNGTKHGEHQACAVGQIRAPDRTAVSNQLAIVSLAATKIILGGNVRTPERKWFRKATP